MAIIPAAWFAGRIDEAPAKNSFVPLSDTFRQVANGNAFLAGSVPRTLLTMHYPGGTTATDPLVRFRYNHIWAHDVVRESRVIAMKLAAHPGGNPRFRGNNSTREVEHMELSASAPNEDAQTYEVQLIENTTAGAAYAERQCGTVDGFNLLSIAIQTHYSGYGYADTARDSVRDPDQFRGGDRIKTAQHSALATAVREGWREHKKPLAAWSSDGFALAKATSVSGTTFTNLIDGSSLARTASTPGLFCRAKNSGFGTRGYAMVRGMVYANCTTAGGADPGADTGQVKFTSSLASVIITGIPFTAAWYAMGTAGLSLDSTLEVDKVDVFGKSTGVNTRVNVWAWIIHDEVDF